MTQGIKFNIAISLSFKQMLIVILWHRMTYCSHSRMNKNERKVNLFLSMIHEKKGGVEIQDLFKKINEDLFLFYYYYLLEMCKHLFK